MLEGKAFSLKVAAKNIDEAIHNLQLGISTKVLNSTNNKKLFERYTCSSVLHLHSPPALQ